MMSKLKLFLLFAGILILLHARHSCEDGTYVVVIHFIHHFGCSDVRCTFQSQKHRRLNARSYYAPG